MMTLKIPLEHRFLFRRFRRPHSLPSWSQQMVWVELDTVYLATEVKFHFFFKLSYAFHLPLVSTTLYPPPSCPEDEDDEAEVDFDLSSPPTKVLEGLAQNCRIE